MSDVATYQLPDGWAIVPVKELGKAITGNTPPTKDPANYGGDIPFIKPTELVDRPVSAGRETISDIGAARARILPKGGVLVSCIGNLGKTAIAKRDVAFNQQINAIVFNETVIPEYGFYYFQTAKFRKDLESLASATTISIVNKSKFESINIPVAPREQQKRIVAKIEELFSHIDAGIEALKKAKQLLKQYRQSVLKAAVTGELTKEWREANKDKLEPASQLLERILKERRQKWEEQQLEQFKAKGKMPKDDKWKEKYKEPIGYAYEGELPDIPDSWAWVSPEQISSTDEYALAIGPFGSNLKVSDYRDEGIPLVFVRNIRAHDYSTENSKYVTHKKAKELRAHSISAGDVLITKMGEPPGDASIYPPTAPDAIITADCIKWRFSSLIKYPELFVHIINSQVIKDQILRRTKGVAQKKISLGTFKSVAFPLPVLEEQGEIFRVLEQKFYAADRLLIELDVQLLKTEKNKQTILAAAFNGRLQ